MVRPTWILALAMAALACRGEEPVPPVVEGHWEFTEAFADLAHHISCADTGSYELTQTGASFAGTYVQRGACQRPEGPVGNGGHGSVTLGRIVGVTVRFRVDPYCDYEGRLDGPTPTAVAGALFCTVTDPVTTYRFSGSWQATH